MSSTRIVSLSFELLFSSTCKKYSSSDGIFRVQGLLFWLSEDDEHVFSNLKHVVSYISSVLELLRFWSGLFRASDTLNIRLSYYPSHLLDLVIMYLLST